MFLGIGASRPVWLTLGCNKAALTPFQTQQCQLLLCIASRIPWTNFPSRSQVLHNEHDSDTNRNVFRTDIDDNFQGRLFRDWNFS